MMVPTALMGPFYGILRHNRDWLVQQGISASDASYFIANTYQSMLKDALVNPEQPNRFDELVAEQTPGGLNEQALANLDALGGLNAYTQAMDAVLSRLEGKSDGSLEE